MEKHFRIPHEVLKPLLEMWGRQNRGKAPSMCQDFSYEQHELTTDEVDSQYDRPLRTEYEPGEWTELVTFPQALKTPPVKD